MFCSSRGTLAHLDSGYAESIEALKNYPVSSLSNLLLPDEKKGAIDSGVMLVHMKRALQPITVAALKAVNDISPPPEGVERSQHLAIALRKAMGDATANKQFMFTDTQNNTKRYHSTLEQFKVEVLIDCVSGFLEDFSEADKQRALKRAADLFNVLTKTVEESKTDSQGNLQSCCVVKLDNGELRGFYLINVMKVTSSLKEVTRGKETTKEVDTQMNAFTDTFEFVGAEEKALDNVIKSMSRADFEASLEVVKALTNNGLTL